MSTSKRWRHSKRSLCNQSTITFGTPPKSTYPQSTNFSTKWIALQWLHTSIGDFGPLYRGKFRRSVLVIWITLNQDSMNILGWKNGWVIEWNVVSQLNYRSGVDHFFRKLCHLVRWKLWNLSSRTSLSGSPVCSFKCIDQTFFNAFFKIVMKTT